MPPKGWRKTASGFQPTNSSGVNIKDRKVHGIEELLLPRALITKLAKQALPEGTPLPKDGVTALLRSATMFISFITSEANQIARQESRKTVTHTDILRALENCQFGSFVSATQELSDKMVVKTRAKESAGDSMAAIGRKADEEDAAAANNEDNDNFIEEDVEPEVNLSFPNSSAGAADVKRPRVGGTEQNSDAEMQVD